MNELIYRLARNRFEAERKRANAAWLLAEGMKARAARLASSAPVLTE
ncbi:hypothetical protein [Streptomyces sp. NPDC127072]